MRVEPSQELSSDPSRGLAGRRTRRGPSHGPSRGQSDAHKPEKALVPLRTLLLALLMLTSAGCGTPRPSEVGSGTIDTETFIEAYIALRRAAAVAGDSASGFEARKQEILDRHGISGQDLLDFVERRGADLPEMVTIWDSIYQRIGRQDSTTGS